MICAIVRKHFIATFLRQCDVRMRAQQREQLVQSGLNDDYDTK